LSDKQCGHQPAHLRAVGDAQEILEPFSTSSSRFQTGWEDIKCDLLEEDFWPAIISDSLVTRLLGVNQSGLNPRT
jgi:hypothetical protein